MNYQSPKGSFNGTHTFDVGPGIVEAESTTPKTGRRSSVSNIPPKFPKSQNKIEGLNVLVIDDSYGNDEGLWKKFIEETELDKRADRLMVLSGQKKHDGKRANDYDLYEILTALSSRPKWSMILLDLQFTSTALPKNVKADRTFGAYLYKKIKEQHPHLHIVMMTSEHQQDLPEDIADVPYISKDRLGWHELVCHGLLAKSCENNKQLGIDQKRKILELTVAETACTDKMLDVFRNAYIQARTSNHICILGESGSGKEVIASYIHRISRDGKPFVATGMGEHNSVDSAIDIGAIFGTEAGVATGVSARKGLIEEAGEGTLFFDEIGEMSKELQSACLRFLQDRKFRPMGAKEIKESKCRLLFATDRDLRDPSILRHQLFERINVNQAIVMPPLREHREDIPELAKVFLKLASAELDKKDVRVEPKALDALSNYNFPNNVRSLKNIITYLVSVKGSRSLITEGDVTGYLTRLQTPIQQSGNIFRLADVVNFLDNVVIDKLDPNLDGAATGTLLKIEKAYIGLLKRATEVAINLKNGKIAPAVSYIVGKTLKSDRRFNYLKSGEILVELSALTVKGAQHGMNGNKKAQSSEAK